MPRAERSYPPGRPASDRRRHEGFTIIELIIALTLGAILVSMTLKGFGPTVTGLAVSNARQSFAALEARARMHAVERGALARLHVDPAGDSIWVEGSGGARVAFENFATSREVDIQSTTTGVITVCMSPRGFAETSCNSFGTASVTLDFVQGPESASLTIRPLGQLEW